MDRQKNRFLLKAIKSIIVVKTHFENYSSNEFDNILLKETKLFESSISSSQKYTKTAEVEIDSTSN